LNENARVVITGDILVHTGIYLQRVLLRLRVPIVTTRAVIPPGFEASDRLQNLSESFIAASMFQPLVVCGTLALDKPKSKSVNTYTYTALEI
jgi:hypothetical protein